ncbi:SDR family oxidoreductase [Streptomyces sp. NPDC004237]|uniref:SDR family NAD(P)-dependent oxidoreductase n=1 Tax=Streptomyces sp. NPDC004237 TaxID=3154455 RepID=UPI0033B46CCE
MDLTGRIAVITGGASGIGAAVADRLRAAGSVPVTWDIAGEPDVHCDVTDENSVAAALDETIARVGVPTVLVAAAGVTGYAQPLVDQDVEGWDRTFAINARGVFLSMRAVARQLVEDERDGCLVAISSVTGIVADPGAIAYGASKAAVNHLVRDVAIELGPFGIRVNAIAPGPTETPMLGGNLGLPGFRQETIGYTPLDRFGTPDLVADALLHVLQADWVTGQVITVDGGLSLMTARGVRRFIARGKSRDSTSPVYSKWAKKMKM